MSHIFKLILVTAILSSCTATPKGITQNGKAAPFEASKIPIYENFSDFEALLHKQNDTTYVINFWATWCKPCVAELPWFEQLHKSTAGEKVSIILVSLDFPKQIETKLYPFIEEHQLQSEVVVLLDGKYNNWIDKVSPEWDGAIPVTLFYKGDKREFVQRPFHDFDELNDIVQKLIKLN